MPTNQNEPGETQGTGGADNNDGAGKFVPREELLSAIEQRQKFKGRLREAEASNAEMAAKLAEYASKDREREEEEMRKRGEFEKLLKAEQESKAEIASKLEQVLWDQKFSATVAAVSAKTGHDPALVEGLLLRHQRVSGADVALEEIDDEGVTGLAKALKSAAPSLFAAKGKGGSPSTPGLNMANKKAGEDETLDAEKARVIALAKSHSYNQG